MFFALINFLVPFFGWIVIGAIVVRLLLWLYRAVTPVNLKNYNPEGRSWALITGASDGIGLAYAKVS